VYTVQYSTYLLPVGQAYFTLFTNMRREEGFPVSREKERLEVGRFYAGWERMAGRFLTGGFLDFFMNVVLYSTLLHVPPLRFDCVGRMLGSNTGQLQLRHWLSEALATRLHL
jgi:hypothetical protein